MRELTYWYKKTSLFRLSSCTRHPFVIQRSQRFCVRLRHQDRSNHPNYTPLLWYHHLPSAMPRPLCSPTQWKGPVPFQRPSDVLARMLHLLRSNTELERALDLARHFKSKSVLRGEDVLMCSWQVLQQTKLWLWAEWCRVSKFTIKIISFW